MNTCSPFITPPLPFCSQTISWVAQWHNYKQYHIYNIYIIIFICTYLYFFFYFYFTFPCAGKSNKMADSADSFSGFFWNSIHKTLIPTRRHVERPLEYFSEVAAVLVFKINKGAFENITSIWNWNSNLYVLFVYIFCLALLTLFTKLASEVLWLFFQDTGQPRAILIVSLSTE